MAGVRGLYPIVDLDSLAGRGLDPLAFAALVLSVAPRLLQLRAKRAAPRDVLTLLRALKPLCARRGTLLIANDRPDLALLGGADGVHVGQTDLPIAEVRRFSSELKVGISTHDLEQLEAALAEAPSYVAFGPIYATASKENPEPVVGLERLARASELARAAGVPLVAIGGITLERGPDVARADALGAVIGDLLADGPSGDAIAKRARALQTALGG